jgi:hypothetical protein
VTDEAVSALLSKTAPDGEEIAEDLETRAVEIWHPDLVRQQDG